MSNDSALNAQIERVFQCIEKNLGINVRDVPVSYLCDIDFLKCIKSNVNTRLHTSEEISLLKEFYIEFYKRIPGLYKWREKTVFIKEIEKNENYFELQ